MSDRNLFTLVSLGCPKNRVDSERILGVLTEAGFTHVQDIASAAVVVINTCAFIEAAVEESVGCILDVRDENLDAFLVVAGCLPLRYREELRPLLPEVGLFVTPDRIAELPRLIRAARGADGNLSPAESGPAPQDDRKDWGGPGIGRMLTTPGYAYLKVAEGCSRRCRYCTIPAIRGPFRSFDPQALEAEAAQLAARGTRELILVAQDLTGYGRDLAGKRGLVDLLERLQRVDGVEWIRLMYLHPDGVPKGLPGLVRDSDKILPYLDIPFQHVSEKVLRAMGRPWKGDRIPRLVEWLRREIPGLVLRTTFMVGYPGEGENEFSELRDFVTSFCLEHVGVFAYSAEDGTGAALLKDQVPEDLKLERADEIGRIHSDHLSRRNRTRIGRTEQALVEGVSSETDLLLQGRTWDQAPEVDGVLYITAGSAQVGSIHKVRITDFHGLDLFGEIG